MFRFFLPLTLLLLVQKPALAIDASKSSILPRVVHSRVPASFSGQHILVNVYLPKAGGRFLTIEIKNKSSFAVGHIGFDLSTYGDRGSLQWDSIAPGRSVKKLFRISKISGLRLDDFQVFDDEAHERFPNLLVQFIRS